MEQLWNYDCLSLGEILIDLGPAGRDEAGAALFEPRPGGAPANVACALARLGRRAGFLGVVGADLFGALCRRALERAGVDARYLSVSPGRPTTLAVVGLNRGERSFFFYREGTADLELSLDRIPADLFSRTRALHFGSLSLTAEPARTATLTAAARARAAGRLVSFDPNHRPPAWISPGAARAAVREAAPLAHVIKLSLEDGESLFGTGDPGRILRRVRAEFPAPLVVVTLGEAGCRALLGGREFNVPAPRVDVRDTTGAGDAFMGGLLHGLLGAGRTPSDLTELDEAEATAILTYAGAAGALAVTAPGAIPALPSPAAIQNLLAESGGATGQRSKP